MKPFVLNNEKTKNSYGFRIKNSGMSLVRFKANPVMLDLHNNSNAGVIGQWTNIIMSGDTLTALPEFDESDANAQTIKGKVERGYIKGASLGVTFDLAKMVKATDGSYDLTSCEVFEASIVPVPSNASALRLYDAASGKLMTEAEVKLCIQTINPDVQLSFQNMDLQKALITLLHLSDEATSDDIINAVKKMQPGSELTIEQVLNAAVIDGKITLTQYDFYSNMAKHDLTATLQHIQSLPKAQKLSVSLTNGRKLNAEDKLLKTLDDYRKYAPEELEKNPTLYKRLCAEEGIIL